MVESIVIKSNSKESVILSHGIINHKIKIDASVLKDYDLGSFDLIITLKNKVTEFRNYDYSWVKIDKDRIATEFSPKIIKLENGFFVQPNVNHGIWEINKNNPKTLYWRFNPQYSNSIVEYTGSSNERIITASNQSYEFNLELLFSKQHAIEFSRSPLPFSAIACFTDHCDFDTLDSIKLQREFFKKNNIKITKGFFLNHFSKREDNASIENNREEFEKWIEDKHELAYHSLSQSLKNKKESINDFFDFKPPFENIPTWIDHGYQFYNFTLFKNNEINEQFFSNNLVKKEITTLWNYIDSGTSTLGVINQLNPEDFTLNSFYKGNKDLSLKSKTSTIIKNIMFHYYADEKMILKYKGLASSFKKMIKEKRISLFFNFISSLLSTIMPICRVLFFWNLHKNKPYKLAKFTPLFFKHKIGNNEFYVFQTIEMVDFKKSLHPKNIDKLINEKGVFIGHTYFSAPMKYHVGRMFKNPKTIDEDVSKNFMNLSDKIKNKKIWNPTLNELILYLKKYEGTFIDVDEIGNIYVKKSADLHYKFVE